MKFVLPLVCVFLVVAYAVGVHYFYKDKFAEDLTAQARSRFSATDGLEDVHVEFRAFDAFLSGSVPSSELRDRAANIVASLPAARVVSNGIAYPGFDPGAASRAAEAELAIAQTRAEPPEPPLPPEPAELPATLPPPPPPPPRTPPHLHFSLTEEVLTLRGAVSDITTKSSFLRAIALSGRYLQIDGGDFVLDPDLAPSDWPDELPAFIAFLLTRTITASILLDGTNVNVTATALDSVSREQVLSRLNKIDFPDRHLRIDISQAPELTIEPEGFFFKATLADGELAVIVRLNSQAESDRFAKILETDLPDLEVAHQFEIDDSLSLPGWSHRLPNLVSLICSRAAGARISTNGKELRVIAEMKPGHAPEDLADVLSLMTGPAASLETRLLPYEEALDPGAALQSEN